MKQITIGMLFVIALVSGCATHKDLPNLSCVDAQRNIWRCGQPTAAGVAQLVAMGVTNSLKLNEEPEPPGLNVYREPITLEQQLFGLMPLQKLDLRADVLLLQPGTVIHCLNGWDRTGLVAAMYRVRMQGWSKADAEREMLAHGFHKSLFGLWDAWQDFKAP